MSKIEEYINQNREIFDSEEPDLAHFERIKKKMNFQNKSQFRLTKSLMKFAALFILVFSVSAIIKFGFFSNSDFADQLSNKNQNSSEFNETENYYQKIYESGLDELNKVSCKSSDIQKNMVLRDIEELNKSYEELKTELKKNPMDSRIKEAMISNYENKVNLLNLVITELKRNC